MNNTSDSVLYEQNCSKILHDWKKNKKHPLTELVMEYFKENKINPRRIKAVHWCGGSGELDNIIGKSSNGNPSDVVIEFGNGEFFGISLKYKNTTSALTYKNAGLGTIGKYLGIDYNTIVQEKYDTLVVDAYGLPESYGERKEYLKSNPELKKLVDMQGHIMLRMLLLHPEWGIKAKYEQMSHKNNVNHIVDFWLDAKNPVIPYVVITERNSVWSLIDPMKSNRRKKLLNSKKILWGVSGTSLTVNLKDLNIMKMRIKYESHKFASSIKFAGEFT